MQRLLSILASAGLLTSCLAGPFVSFAFADEAAVKSAADGVYCLGRIEPDKGIRLVGVTSMVNAVNGAVLTALTVEAGDEVTKGQLLAELDTAQLERAEVAIAQAGLELAKRRAEQRADEEKDVCSRAEVAQRTATRRSSLHKSGVASDEEADVASGDARALSASCSAARIASKAAAAETDLAAAKIGRAEAELERSLVRAPMDGRVIRIIRRPGELAGAEGVLQLANLKKMYAIAEVYETDIGRVRIGQKATVTSKALSAPLSGTVEHIRLQVRKQDVTGTDPAARKDARIVEVEVLLDDPAPVATLTNLQVEVLIGR